VHCTDHEHKQLEERPLRVLLSKDHESHCVARIPLRIRKLTNTLRWFVCVCSTDTVCMYVSTAKPCTMYHVPCTIYHVPCTMYHVQYTIYYVPCLQQNRERVTSYGRSLLHAFLTSLYYLLLLLLPHRWKGSCFKGFWTTNVYRLSNPPPLYFMNNVYLRNCSIFPLCT
jgi:hypothetical protein